MCHLITPADRNEEEHEDLGTVRGYRHRNFSMGGVLVYKDGSKRSCVIKNDYASAFLFICRYEFERTYTMQMDKHTSHGCIKYEHNNDWLLPL